MLRSSYRGARYNRPKEARIAKPPLKRDWAPAPASFTRLLAWLDEGVDSGGERYVEVRRRIAAYFTRRRRGSPDDLADETLNRVARRLEEEGIIADAPIRYCYVVARFVFLESLRSPALQLLHDADAPSSSRAGPGDPEDDVPLECLDRCLASLSEPDRELILQYYRDDSRTRIDQRRALAARRGMSPNALAIRACRIRGKLEACVRGCLPGR